MSLQTQVNIQTATGIPGEKAVPDQAVYTPLNYIAGEGIVAGHFCFASSDANVAAGAGTTVLGFVERVIGGYLYDITAEGSLEIPEGEALTIADKGDFYAETAGDATAGGTVYADKKTGAVLTAAGTDGIATGWKFATSGTGIVIISNH